MERLTLSNLNQPIDNPPLETRLVGLQSLSQYATGQADRAYDQISLQQDQIDLLKAQVARQDVSIHQLQSANTGSLSNSVITLLGNTFKTLGEALLAIPQTTSSQSSDTTSQTSSTSNINSVSDTAPNDVPNRLTISANQVSIDSPGETGHDIAAAFDGAASTYFAKQYSASYPVAMVIDMGTSKTLTQIKVYSRNLADQLTPRALEIYVSNDGVSYSLTLTRQIERVSSGGIATINTDGQVPASRYYKFNFIGGGAWDPNQLQFAEFQLYGY
ncbi:MAG: discoidin domain-containing protein [Nanoarchaeota archaeon]